jgi:hypothetical protein
MLLFKFLHIGVMFVAVVVALGPELLLRGIGRSGDVRAIRVGYSLADRLGRAIPALFGIGLVFGLLTAWSQGLNFFAPWLLVSYVLFVVATVVGARFTTPHIAHVAELAGQSPNDSPSPELAAALADRRGDILFAFDAIIIVAFIFDMVLKPFS